jgi:transposase
MKKLLCVYIGVDVSKELLTVNAGDYYRGDVPNSAVDIRRLIKELKRKIGRDNVPQVCFESTGPYGSALFEECARAEVPASVLNPAKVRHFAKAMSESAKTDPIDARVIRLYSEAKQPVPTHAPGKAERLLRQLILAREALTKSVVQLSGTLESMTEPVARRFVAQSVEKLKERIKTVDKRVATALKEDARLDGLAGELSKIEGVGGLSAAKIIALVPELGTLGRRDSAALAGLAPFARDSGKFKGKTFVGGGRADVRRALFMPATVAIRYNPVLKTVYERLRKAGKPYKVALTAVMRKLFQYMDRVAARWYAEHGGTVDLAAPTHVSC